MNIHQQVMQQTQTAEDRLVIAIFQELMKQEILQWKMSWRSCMATENTEKRDNV